MRLELSILSRHSPTAASATGRAIRGLSHRPTSAACPHNGAPTRTRARARSYSFLRSKLSGQVRRWDKCSIHEGCRRPTSAFPVRPAGTAPQARKYRGVMNQKGLQSMTKEGYK